MLDVRRLSLLRDLAHFGTIAAVAQARNFTPSAVSQQLSALEREAGVPLLARTGRGVTLTSAGDVLVQQAGLVLAALEQASAAVASSSSVLSGPLRIGAFPTAVRTLLPAALVALGAAHPQLELMVSELDPAAVPGALHERRIDVGLVHDYDIAPVEPDSALDGVPLFEETVFLAAAESAPRTTGDLIKAARDAPWIVSTPGTLCHTVAMRLCGTAGFAPRVRHHADDFATVLALVAAGQGVSLVPQLAALEPPLGVRLQPLRTRRRTRIAYRQGVSGSPAIIAAVSAIRTSAAACLAG